MKYVHLFLTLSIEILDDDVQMLYIIYKHIMFTAINLYRENPFQLTAFAG